MSFLIDPPLLYSGGRIESAGARAAPPGYLALRDANAICQCANSC